MRARRAMSSDSVPRALVSLVRRNRRRYGGYIVHAGVARAARRRRRVVDFQDVARRAPGARRERARRRTTTHLRRGRPATSTSPRTARSRRSTSARTCACAAATASRSRCTPSAATSRRATRASAPCRATSRARRPARSACDAGLRRDFWTVGRARHRARSTAIAERGDRVFEQAQRAARARSARPRSARRCAAWSRATARSAAGPLPGARLAARDLDLARRADRLRRRADRDLAGAGRRAPPSRRPTRRASRASSAAPDGAAAMEVLLVLAVLAVAVLVIAARCAAARPAPDDARVAASAPSSRPRRRPSTARSATPSSTTAPASSRTRTGGPRRELRAEAIELLRRLDALDDSDALTGAEARRLTLSESRAADLRVAVRRCADERCDCCSSLVAAGALPRAAPLAGAATFSAPDLLEPDLAVGGRQVGLDREPGRRHVSVIDTKTNKVIEKIKVGDEPQSVAVDPNNRYAYVANAPRARSP